jgi:hypothetical protein
MQFTIAIAALFAGVAFGAPAQIENRQVPYVPCSGLYGTSQCCATDVLGVADLDCANPPTVPTDAANYTAICADIGQRARCCVLPIVSSSPVLGSTPPAPFHWQRSLTQVHNSSARTSSARPLLASSPSRDINL